MRVWDRHLQEQPDLLSALGLLERPAPTVSVVGAGGKTSLILALAGEYATLGKKALVTTTTHLFNPDYLDKPLGFPFVPGGAPEAVAGALESAGAVMVGLPLEHNPRRIEGLPPESLALLRPLADVFLIEADGSRRLPCKAPGDHEPVIAPGTDLVIGVLGLDSLEEAIEQICFRPERVSALLNKPPEARLTEADLAALIVSDQGLRKNVAGAFVAVLNKADSLERRLAAARIAAMLAEKGVQAFITCRSD